MNNYFEEVILKSTKAAGLYEIEVLQSLWSGYGVIKRYGLKGSSVDSVVVKHVVLSGKAKHPRGWNTDFSHQRKAKSYDVEMAWYREWSSRCGENCRVPKCFASDSKENEVLIVMEDLDSAGFDERKEVVSIDEIKLCLKWLANFHATFMNVAPTGLWKSGTYWHLETRPDELEALNDIALKKAAQLIDEKLNKAAFQTFVQGDAKLANFCFSKDSKKVAAVDFQYVGGGCGMKDVAYFIGSCLSDDESEVHEQELLDYYFFEIKQSLNNAAIDLEALEQEWRDLYSFAWADFHRFLKGWSPGHWKINSYSERLVRETLQKLSRCP